MHWLVRSSSFSKAQGLRETGSWVCLVDVGHNYVQQNMITPLVHCVLSPKKVGLGVIGKIQFDK